MFERDKTKYLDSSKREPRLYDGDAEVWVGPLEVLKSPAGWYIGRLCWVEDKHGDGYQEPLSRESDYYRAKEEAEAELKDMTFEVRDCVENNFAYEQGDLPRPGTEPK